MLIRVFTRMPSKLIQLDHGDKFRLKLKFFCFNYRLPDYKIIISNNGPPKVFHSSLSLRSVHCYNWNVLLYFSLLCHNYCFNKSNFPQISQRSFQFNIQWQQFFFWFSMHVLSTRSGITLRSNEISRQHQCIMISSYKKSVAQSTTAVQNIFENFMFN